MLESKRKAIIFLVLSFLLAIAAGLFFLQKVREINSELGGMATVYVAAVDIPSRTVIQPNQVKTTEIPKRFLNEAHVTDVEGLINQVLVVPLSSGDLITKNMTKAISNTRNENNRLVALFKSERLHFDQDLEPLDRIDIIVSSRLEGTAPKTELFMKDVLVANVFTNDGTFSGIVVEIPADDAPSLIHAQNYSDSIRILQANVGKEEAVVTDVQTGNPSEEEGDQTPVESVEGTESEAEEEATVD